MQSLTCSTCGVVFQRIVKKRNRNAKNYYCSRECQNKRKVERPGGTCELCGKEFVRKIDRGGARDSLRFCSRDCAFQFKRENSKIKPKFCKVHFIECVICGVLFTSRDNRSLSCSVDCKKEIVRKRNGVKLKTEVCKKCKHPFETYYSEQVICRYCINKETVYFDKKCLICFCDFTTFNEAQATCSSKCSTVHLRRKRAEYKSQRNERTARVLVDKNINVIDLHKRDRGVCKICGEKVSLRKKHPDPMSASIDHILPLAKGGWHEWTNVQLAHLRCNIVKKDKVPRQRRIGLFECLRS